MVREVPVGSKRSRQSKSSGQSSRRVSETKNTPLGKPARSAQAKQIARLKQKLGLTRVRLAKDISALKRAHKALQQSEEKFRFLADNVPAFFAYIDANERYQFVNKRYEEIHETTREEMIGKSIREVYGKENYQSLRAHVETVLSGKPVSFEWSGALRSWGAHRLSSRYEPRFNAQGKVGRFFVLTTDVTELRQAEADLKPNQQELR